MITFPETDTIHEFILTLSELITVNEPIYDFVFTHVLTKKQVLFSLTENDDSSDFPDRYNSFTIDVTQFTEPGEWHYTVTEQQTGEILENGKMIIIRDFNYSMYAGTTS